MNWHVELIEALAGRYDWPYHAEGPGAAEPTAMAALALVAAGREEAARRAGDSLVDMQRRRAGSVGVTKLEEEPCWPTGLAICAWRAIEQATSADYGSVIDRAVSFLLQLQGKASEQQDEVVGHDTALVGWPWVEGTHSWLEPTAFSVLGLKAVGLGNHARVRAGVELLIDRQLPGGGCNYGNTSVFGQKLVAHLQPSGLALLSLSDEPLQSRIAKSTTFLRNAWPHATGTASICFAALGLAAMGEVPLDLDARLESLYDQQVAGSRSPYQLAMLALAALGTDCPLIPGGSPLQPPQAATHSLTEER